LGAANTLPSEQFADYEHQHAASTLGMWVFLITELMFFGALFLIYAVGCTQYPEAFSIARRELNPNLGAINTAVLIVSSLAMALAVHAAQNERKTQTLVYLAATLSLGCAFLAIKAYEYHDKYIHHLIPGSTFGFPEPHSQAAEHFFSLYFAMTGTHALHIVIGAGMLLVLTFQALRGRFTSRYHTPIEMVGLYWHFVDIIWIFLFPLLYLTDFAH
jgi:cytochrome c oxidase subunit III